MSSLHVALHICCCAILSYMSQLWLLERYHHCYCNCNLESGRIRVMGTCQILSVMLFVPKSKQITTNTPTPLFDEPLWGGHVTTEELATYHTSFGSDTWRRVLKDVTTPLIHPSPNLDCPIGSLYKQWSTEIQMYCFAWPLDFCSSNLRRRGLTKFGEHFLPLKCQAATTFDTWSGVQQVDSGGSRANRKLLSVCSAGWC